MVQPVERAALLMQARCPAPINFVLDEMGRLIALPSAPGWHLNPELLSYDGTQVLFRCSSVHGGMGMLLLYRLGTGQKQSFPMPVGALTSMALSPDGRTLAMLRGVADGLGEVMVDLMDVTSQVERRIFALEGRLDVGSLSWSPDGQLLLLSYEVNDSGMVTTVVLNPDDGSALFDYPNMRILRDSNGAWLDSRKLVLIPEEPGEPLGPLVVADVLSGDLDRQGERPREWTGEWATIVAGRLAQTLYLKGIYTTGLDGSDPRPLITIGADAALDLVDVAPQVTQFA